MCQTQQLQALLHIGGTSITADHNSHCTTGVEYTASDRTVVHMCLIILLKASEVK